MRALAVIAVLLLGGCQAGCAALVPDMPVHPWGPVCFSGPCDDPQVS